MKNLSQKRSLFENSCKSRCNLNDARIIYRLGFDPSLVLKKRTCSLGKSVRIRGNVLTFEVRSHDHKTLILM